MARGGAEDARLIALLRQGVALHQAGRLAEAEACYRQILAVRRDLPDALNLLGTLRHQQGHHDEAARLIERALKGADNPSFHNNLGQVRLALGEPGRAADAFRRTLRTMPGHLGARVGLARAAGGGAWRPALLFDPADADGWLGLGAWHLGADRLGEAEQVWRRAFAIAPTRADVLGNLGNLGHLLARSRDGERALGAALLLAPERAATWANWGNVVLQRGDVARAGRAYDRALRCDSALTAPRWQRLRLLPAIYRDAVDIAEHRARFEQYLGELEAATSLGSADAAQRALAGALTGANFQLAYQGEDDRALQARYARLIRNVTTTRFPTWRRAPRPPERARRRIGFVSAHWREHTIAKLFGGWIINLDPARFETVLYHIGPRADARTERLAGHAALYRHLPRDFEAAARVIADDRCDVLIYPDIGMEARAQLLAALRLAPVQMAAWGHPVTTGLETVDAFLTSDLMEPGDATAHYSERLIRLPHLSIAYARPELPTPRHSRADFGLEDGTVAYLCCQSLFKYLPANDMALAGIATRVPQARFVFIGAGADTSSGAAAALRARLEDAFAARGLDARTHVRFVPPLDAAAYLDLNRITDVYLDSIGWSGGNTTFEAVACGLPIVTLPGRFMRGRHSAAILRRMDVTGTIARDVDDYAEIAARLADPAARAAARAEIASRSEAIYDDLTPVRALEDVLSAPPSA
jgi:predicted O-linked N-acetylglucosamine transferase (SPINDLY family)